MIVWICLHWLSGDFYKTIVVHFVVPFNKEEQFNEHSAPILGNHLANDAANLEMGPANGLRPICDQAGPQEVSTASQSGEVQGSIRPANADESMNRLSTAVECRFIGHVQDERRRRSNG
jgi:hypothetical protein